MTGASGVVVLELDEMKLGPTACLFEGCPRAGVGVSMFIVRTPPGGAVELHARDVTRLPKRRRGAALGRLGPRGGND